MLAYRLITEDDNSEFCHRVTAALSVGWQLYGAPQYAFDHEKGKMRCAQAITKEVDVEYHRNLPLNEL